MTAPASPLLPLLGLPLLGLPLLAHSGPALADPVTPGQSAVDLLPPDLPVGAGELRVATADGLGALVLAATDVHAEVHAGLARVVIHQVFENPYDHGIEATYLLPLPPDAAVDHLRLVVGERTITGEIRPRDEAREAYEEARAEGRKASLLEQQRDNLFTQAVSGICAGEAVAVTVSYVQEVPLDDGVYRLALPLTVGPRFAPPDRVADAAAVATPYSPADLVAREVELTVVVDEGLPVQGLWSDSHDVTVVDEGGWGAEIALEPHDTLPNKDFVLEWTLATDQPVASLLAHRPDPAHDGYLALRLEPQVVEDLVAPQPRELLFLVDASGSMRGQPYDTATETVMQALAAMRPGDTFNLVRFSDGASRLFPTARAATPEAVAAARDWLSRYEGGGTRMDAGIIEALTAPTDGERLRMVLLLTDGWLGDEEHTFRTVEAHLGDARVFALGVGSSPNRLLLDGVADLGRGTVVEADLDDDPARVAADFLDRIAHPAMTDLSIDWGALEVHDVFPARIPDLWAGRTLAVSARYDTPLDVGDLPTTVTVTGRVDGRPYTLQVPVEVPARTDAFPAARTLWARRQLADLTRRPWLWEESALEDEVTRVAMVHGLVSAHTSLVAVDQAPPTCAVEASVQAPHLLPAGTDPGFAQGAGVLGAYGAGGMGAGSLGFRGQGLGGGGGTASAIGGLGTAGRGSGFGGALGAKGFAQPSAARADARTDEVVVVGALDGTLVDEVVKRHLNAVRYCYQRELQRIPGLAGDVTMKLVIAPDGTVSSAQVAESTLGSPTVERCLVARFTRMAFPATRGGGIVIVRYPLRFSAKP